MGSALPSLGLPSKAHLYGAALEGLVQVNGCIMGADPRIPPLYASGAVWRKIPHTNWRRADQIAGERWGDCEGMSAYRAAECRMTGEDPDARVACYHTGPATYHAVVIRGDDSIEDPSVILGMPARRNMPRTRDELNVINGNWPRKLERAWVTVGWDEERESDDGVATKLVEKPTGESAGQIKIPLLDGTSLIAQTTPAMDKAVTAARTGNMLADVVKEVAKNPLLLAQLNPTTAAAVRLYNQPDVQKSLKALGSGAKSILRKLF